MSLILPDKNFYVTAQLMEFDGNTVHCFDSLFDKVKEDLKCSYISYALEKDKEKRIHYYSNRKWQSIFVGENLIKDCPLIAYSELTDTRILEWNTLSGILNKKQKRVMDARADFNIGNGIGLKQYVYGMREIVTFAAPIERKKFSQDVFNHLEKLKKYVHEMRTLAVASMLIQGWLSLDEIHCKSRVNLQENVPKTVH